ncbi:uncharacterized protein LOC125279751 [Megalobrama amblycephala]|uniref:uncharacterized protein LOC125279751 n=1 Tax=Megalobrama amblycephala TaxID=75352 RepID=UPI0020143068|nr:uncharacterized protein LOC125279751 [Megalobrama amblycephala]
MDLLMYICVVVIPVISDGFIVKGPSGPLVAPLGSSVVLPCYVDKPLLTEDLEVEWRRTDSETLVHLYQDGESRPEAQQEEYHDRAHFFTDQIQHGNFSLRLDNLTAEDEGKYRCKVSSQQDFGETVVQIKDVERLLVSGSDESISVSVGEDVTLSCSVDSHIKPEHIEEVSWKKTDEDILVLLYQNNETLPDSSHEQYRDRVEFFTDEIPKGNFSLRLKSVRTEDKGVYICQVFAGGLSANATAELEKLGFSVSHIMVLILCVSAFGFALLFFFIIYCSNNESTATNFRTFGLLHTFIPNIIMFVAFIFWGLTEGFLYETVSCCALYILRPLMLIYVAPYLKKMSDEALFTEMFIFIIVYCSVILTHSWETIVWYVEIDKVVVVVLFGVVMLLIAIGLIYLLTKKKRKSCGDICKWTWHKLAFASAFIFVLLPSLQFALVAFALGAARGGIFVPILVLAVSFLSFSCLYQLKGEKSCLELFSKIAWIIFIFVSNAVVIIFYIIILEKERDAAGWICMAVFQQVLWMITVYMIMGHARNLTLTFKKMLYVFGSVGVVLLNSVTLMTELILTTVNGKRAVCFLRIIVFSSESIFAFSLLILLMFGPWISDMPCCQKALRTNDIPVTGSHQNQDSQNAAESEETPANGSNQNQEREKSHEMNHLLNQDQKAGIDVTEENQPDSVKSQT